MAVLVAAAEASILVEELVVVMATGAAVTEPVLEAELVVSTVLELDEVMELEAELVVSAVLELEELMLGEAVVEGLVGEAVVEGLVGEAVVEGLVGAAVLVVWEVV